MRYIEMAEPEFNQSCLQVRNTTCRRVDGIIAAAARGAQRCLPLFAYSASLQWLND